MIEFLDLLFARLCGQNPGHTWAPGGVPLPCCQRCSGLYAGAAIAALALVWLRPRLGKRFVEAHAVCLLSMVPFGLHWIPQGPVLRTLSGVLFGFGVTAFLWLPVAGRLGWAENPRQFAASAYPGALILALALVPVFALWGGSGAACALSLTVGAGAASLLALALAAVMSIALPQEVRLANVAPHSKSTRR